MITEYNAKALAALYKIAYSTFQSYLEPHRVQIIALATHRAKKGNRQVRVQNYNSRQLQHIIHQVMKDTPEGYEFNGKTLIKLSE